MTTTKHGGLGWRRQLPDHRDYKYNRPMDLVLPSMVDLRLGCPPVFDQGQLGCHREGTEVLTETGWQKWEECVNTSVRLGTIHPMTHALEWQAAQAWHVYGYSGPMVEVEHASLDFSVTPNHRMYVRPWNQAATTLSPEFCFREAGKLGWYSGLLAAPTCFHGTEIGSISIGDRRIAGDDFVALLGVLLADGWVSSPNSDNPRRSGLYWYRSRLAAEVAALAYRCGFRQQPARDVAWHLDDPAFTVWLRSNCFAGGDEYTSPFKRIPAILRACSDRQVARFLTFYGDQHEGKNRQFYTSSQGMADDLQELLLRIGKRSGIYVRDPRSSRMTDGRVITGRFPEHVVTQWSQANLSIEKKRQLAINQYQGNVFCATVPNSLLVTRRNGQVLISGNSCTANGIVGAFMFARAKEDGVDPATTPMLSRLFLYYCERAMEGTTSSDAGANIRDGIKCIVKQGLCLESTWPYDIKKFADKPDQLAYDEATGDEATQYQSVSQSKLDIMAALATGYPVVFGFTVYESFEGDDVASSGIVPMPDPTEAVLGGHCVLCVGYDNSSQRYTCRNSWSAAWGDGGYFYMPYPYLESPDLSSDFWIVTRTT